MFTSSGIFSVFWVKKIERNGCDSSSYKVTALFMYLELSISLPLRNTPSTLILDDGLTRPAEDYIYFSLSMKHLELVLRDTTDDTGYNNGDIVR